MTIPTAAGEHLEDGVLVRLLDDQADASEAAEVRDHLAACAGCRSRLELLRRRGATLSRILARTDFAAPSMSASTPMPMPTAGPARPDGADVIPLRRPAPMAQRPWMRAAAIVLVALGVGVLASPARAWIARWVSERMAAVSGTPDAGGERPVAAPMPVAPLPGSSVRFTPAGDEFTLTIAHAQAAGTLTLAPVNGAEVVAEVVPGTGDAELLVLPAGLRVGNEPGAAAEFRVGIPASVRRVRLRVGAGPERVVARGEMGEEMRIGLAGAR